MTMTNVQLEDIKGKLRECSQEQLLNMHKFVLTLYKTRRSNAAYATAQSLVAGQRVRVVGAIRPKHWIGRGLGSPLEDYHRRGKDGY